MVMETHLCSILTRTGGGGASGILSGRPDWFLLDYTRVAVNIADLVLWQAGQHQRGQAYWQKLILDPIYMKGWQKRGILQNEFFPSF